MFFLFSIPVTKAEHLAQKRFALFGVHVMQFPAAEAAANF